MELKFYISLKILKIDLFLLLELVFDIDGEEDCDSHKENDSD
jgi:hypothetical protein